MFALPRQFFFIIVLIVACGTSVEAYQRTPIESSPSLYVSNRTWTKVKKYLIPDDHPVKEGLDLIFSASRALCDAESLKEAGFSALPPQHHTQVIVAKHPKLPGYVIKAYLDEQKRYANKPEYMHWIKRIKGARLIQRYLEAHRHDNLFKVPKKWLYLLPDEPSPPLHYLRKVFILVAEDMELFDDATNERLWGGEWVTKTRLDVLYKITTDLGLSDSAKPSNCSFSIDGKAAFVDTELYRRATVKYERLAPYLSPPMQEYWKKITHNPYTLP